MINYITRNKLFKYLPRDQIREDYLVLLHLRTTDGDNFYCFTIDSPTDTIFLYYVPSLKNSKLLYDELSYCPISRLLHDKVFIVKNSKMIGKNYRGVVNEHFHKNKK